MKLKFITSLILFSAFISNNIFAEQPSEQATDNELVFHAVQSEKVKEIMNRLVESIYNTEINAAQKKEIRMQQVNELFDRASELYIAAEGLTQALPGIDLQDEEKTAFENIARQLQIEANNLGYMAENDDLQGMELAFKRLNDTCAVCHDLFRF